MRGHFLSSSVALLASACALAACGDSDKPSGGGPDTGTQAAAKPLAQPSVKFVAPSPGATTGSTTKIRVALDHFKIAPNSVGKAPRPGEGHLHFKMDGGKYDYPRFSGPNGRLAKALHVAGHYSPSLATSITYRHLPKGAHTVDVYLANNNHTNTGVEQTLKFHVR